MLKYYELLTDISSGDLAKIRSGGVHPMEAKKQLASKIVTEYHDDAAAARAQRYFESKHQRREVPEDVPVFRIDRDMWICELMKQIRFAPSTSEGRRLVVQGAVRVDGQVVSDVNFRFVPGEHKVLEVGKRRVARIEK
jgi:tyrosyl-tRNA synthetase